MTVLGMPRWVKILLLAGLPVVGALLGFFLPRIVDWAGGWLPLPGPVEWLANQDSWWATAIACAAGLVGGVLLAGIALDESLEVIVTDDEVRFKLDDKVRTFPRADIHGVFVASKQLVLLGKSTEELARDKHESTTEQIARGFTAHGYPWLGDQDPYAADFHRWVPDTPDLPPAVNALLKARQKALQKKERADLAELRTEVGKLGFVVRDEQNQQYWRPVKT